VIQFHSSHSYSESACLSMSGATRDLRPNRHVLEDLQDRSPGESSGFANYFAPIRRP
jgi:hypothetical protein